MVRGISLLGILAIVIRAGSFVHATPLQATFSSCIDNYDAVAESERMQVDGVYANYVKGSEAVRQGLVGDGNDVLRVDLVGRAESEVKGYDNATNKLATLFTDTSAAHISVYESATWLCNSLFPANLPSPYYPFNTTYCPLPAGDYALNVSIPLYRSYALTTLRTQIRIVDTSTNARTLACYNMSFTPYRHDGWYYNLFLYLPVVIAIGFWTVTWAARFATGWIVGSGVAEYGQKEGYAFGRGKQVQATGGNRDARMRKWGTMIISGLSGERLSVSSALLRFVTPGLRDIIHYIQFCTMLGMLAVHWPPFAYPINAQGAWADLIWNMTLVQGSNASSERSSDYPSGYTAPIAFANMMNDPYYPLYLEQDAYNPLFDLRNAKDGIEAWSAAVGLRRQDLFGTCLVIFLCLTLGVTLISVLLWILHGFLEFASTDNAKRPAHFSQRNSLGSSPQASLGGKEAYEPRSYGWDSEGPQLPTQSSLAIAQHTRSSAPTRLRRTWFRFRPKGEAGAFHAAALYGNLLRLILMFHLPITAFSIYQLCLSSASIVSRVFAALSFVFLSVLIPAGILFKIKRTVSGKLYDATRTLLSLGTMYNVYIEDKQMFRAVLLGASLVEGIAVGAGQGSGLAQAIVFVLVELVLLVLPAVWFPWADGAGMGAPTAFVAIVRTACAVLAMLLSHTLGMTGSTRDWLAYSILLLHAIVFIFFALMLLTKLVEGLIRLFGGAHFDESTSPLDSGLFAAIMDLDCLNGVRGGKAAQRKRRKRGSRQLQRNVSAVGSLTTQMMLDRHSLGVQRLPVSDVETPFSNYPPFESQGLGKTPLNDPIVAQQSYFPGYQPPLGPPPLERHSSDSRSDEPSHSDHIMDAWRPAQPVGYAPTGYAPTGSSPGWNDVPSSLEALRTESGVHRSFSVLRGGRADFDNPYDVKANEPGRALSPPPMRIASPSKPSHSRQHSSSAIIERYDNSAPPSPGLNGVPAIYPPGHSGPRANNQGLRPPMLAIPKRRSLNNLRDDPSPDSQHSNNAAAKFVKGKKSKRKTKSKSGWFEKEEDSETSPVESDDEPGPGQRRRPPQPFEPAPSPLGDMEYYDTDTYPKKKKGWKAALGFGGKADRREVNDTAEMARDENRARKAALATASGSMFAGVEAPSPPPVSRGFVVNRKPARPAVTPIGSGAASSTPGPSGSQGEASTPRSFKVKRADGYNNTSTNINNTPSISVTDNNGQTSHTGAQAQRPGAKRNNSAEMGRAIKGQPGGRMYVNAYNGQPTQIPLKAESSEPVRSFKVLGRKTASDYPSSSPSPGDAAEQASPTGSSFVFHRNRPSEERPDSGLNIGYPPTSFVPRE